MDLKKKGFNSNINSVSNLNQASFKDFIGKSKELSEFINLKKISKLKFGKFIRNSESKFVFSLINLKIFLEKNTL